MKDYEIYFFQHTIQTGIVQETKEGTTWIIESSDLFISQWKPFNQITGMRSLLKSLRTLIQTNVFFKSPLNNYSTILMTLKVTELISEAIQNLHHCSMISSKRKKFFKLIAMDVIYLLHCFFEISVCVCVCVCAPHLKCPCPVTNHFIGRSATFVMRFYKTIT